MENDGYEAVQLGFEDVKETRSTKPSKGHAAKANTAPKRSDERLNALAELVHPQRIVPTTVEIVDIAGLVKEMCIRDRSGSG